MKQKNKPNLRHFYNVELMPIFYTAATGTYEIKYKLKHLTYSKLYFIFEFILVNFKFKGNRFKENPLALDSSHKLHTLQINYQLFDIIPPTHYKLAQIFQQRDIDLDIIRNYELSKDYLTCEALSTCNRTVILGIISASLIHPELQKATIGYVDDELKLIKTIKVSKS